MWQAFLLWAVKTLGARLITKEMVLVILAAVFEALYAATKLTSVKVDDDALLTLDNAIDREKLAQGLVDALNSI